jgi:hypothetical protein
MSYSFVGSNSSRNGAERPQLPVFAALLECGDGSGKVTLVG